MKRLLAFVLVVSAASTSWADPTFFVAPNSYPGYSAADDVAWQTAIGSFAEWDFDTSSEGWYLVNVGGGPISVDTYIGNQGGPTTGHPEIFGGTWGGPATGAAYGTVDGLALLNRGEDSIIRSDMIFRFSLPSTGIGAWLFDDGSQSAESFVLEVTEVGGNVYTSLPLDAENGNVHFVEGFLGVVSTVGITEARFRVIDASTLATVQRAFELDHLQTGLPAPTVPAPSAILLGTLGAGALGWLRRRKAL